MKKVHLMALILFFAVFSCSEKEKYIQPIEESITESVYASGIVKSKNQYQVFASVNGIVENMLVSEGDTVKINDAIVKIVNETSKLSADNAALAVGFTNFESNENMLNELRITIDFAKNKFLHDSIQLERQVILWNQQVGSKADLEQKELIYQNSKTTYQTSQLKYEELNKQLKFTAAQSKKNLMISRSLESDYTVKSEIAGKVYSILKKKGEMINLQTPLAIIGDANVFILELQVDEYDIVRIIKGQQVLIRLDSYKGQAFEAKVSKINPLMNERTKTFLIEAEFIEQPKVLYPFLTVEANIVIQSKKEALTLPRNYVTDDNFVKNINGELIEIKTGLKDYNKIEIISGITKDEQLLKP